MNKEQLLATLGNPTFTPVRDRPPDTDTRSAMLDVDVKFNPEPPDDQDRYAGLVDDQEEEWPR